MCCAVAALLLAAFTLWRSGLGIARAWWLRLRWPFAAAVALAAISGSALAVQHFRSGAHTPSILEELAAMPICGAAMFNPRNPSRHIETKSRRSA